jgi:RimJ/RimL family protein N-acetyltransferase
VTVVRPARLGEIPALTTVAGDVERNDATAAYLTALLEADCTRPEWCLVAEAPDGRLVGSVVLWSPPGRDIPTDIVLFEPYDEPTAAALLDAAGDSARGLGAARQAHVLDQPAQAPQFQRDPQRRTESLRAAGFRLDRDGCRFKWSADAAAIAPDDPRLTWRSLADLGEEPFVELLADVLSQTDDAIFRAEVAEHGLHGAAELNFQDCLDFDHQPEWYEIGFADGRPAALSLPAKNGSYPIIALVGVASAHRGQGFANAVVARGTRILADDGATEIRGDCDAANIGMFKAFQRCGYVNFANRQMYSRAL